MRHLLSALLSLFVGTAHCAEPIAVQTLGFQCIGMKYSIKLPQRMSALRALGPIAKEEVVHTEQWDGYKAIEVALHFQGLKVSAVTFTNDRERYNLSAARITSSKWTLSPFRVGQAALPVLRELGAKAAANDGTWRFSGESDSLLLEIKQGRVTEVTYECYTG